MNIAYVLTETEPEPSGSHAELTARYFRHVDGAHKHDVGSLKAWHILMAQGLYRLLADIECNGGESAPMGMPHVLCISAAEACSMVRS
jgi:hypothetical protein